MSRSKKSPTILRDLKIKSVSVVDQGANQHAHIRLAKRAEDTDTDTGSEEQLGNEAAFFTRIGQAVAKMLHLTPKSFDAEEVEKGDAHTFDAINASQQTREKIYRIADALAASLHSIIGDEDLSGEQKAGMINQTADEVAQTIKSEIAGIFGGTTVAKADEAENSEAGEPEANTDTTGTIEPEVVNHQEGEVSDMKFNTEAMTAEERAQLEDLQKRYGMAEDAADQTDSANTDSAAQAAQTNEADNDIYKGINPAVKAEIESLRKFREDAEEREIMEVAKRYTIIGKKPEELAPVLKGLKAAGGTAYADMIAVLDSAVQTVEKSGVFSEIGKRGNGGSTSEDAWGKIEVAAQEIVKSYAGMSYAQAIDKACMDHPDLLEAYESSRK